MTAHVMHPGPANLNIRYRSSSSFSLASQADRRYSIRNVIKYGGLSAPRYRKDAQDFRWVRGLRVWSDGNGSGFQAFRKIYSETLLVNWIGTDTSVSKEDNLCGQWTPVSLEMKRAKRPAENPIEDLIPIAENRRFCEIKVLARQLAA